MRARDHLSAQVCPTASLAAVYGGVAAGCGGIAAAVYGGIAAIESFHLWEQLKTPSVQRSRLRI
eukprot:538187-Rhodomonas_salina.1